MAEQVGSLAPGLSLPERIGHYRLGQALGVGATGWVFRATDEATGNAVALKVLHSHLLSRPGFRERFAREARAASLFRSPHVVRALDSGEESGLVYLVMELAQGQTLRDLLTGGPLPPAQAIAIATAVAGALIEAESLGVLHRDIKPENIVIQHDGLVRVVDFGLAKFASSPEDLTTTGNAGGSVAYMAWEQANGSADHRADMYSLGATLYHILAGSPPFEGDLFDVLMKHREAPVPAGPLSHVPEPLRQVVLRCLEKDPARRYQTAADVLSALAEADSVSSARGRARLINGKPFTIVCAALSLVFLAGLYWLRSIADPQPGTGATPTPMAVATGPTGAVLESPAPGTMLTSADVTFTWAPGTWPAGSTTKYDIWLGTRQNIGDIFSMPDGPQLRADVQGLPLDGRTIYVRLISSDGSEENTFNAYYTFPTAGAELPRTTREFALDPRLVLDTGIEIAPGDTVAINASGSIAVDTRAQQMQGPNGNPGCPDVSMPGRLVPKTACWSLVAAVGDGPYFFVGDSFARSGLGTGRLQFAVNDDNFSDNSGSFAVTVTVTRGPR